MIEQLISWDKSLLLFLNSQHTPFWDIVMYNISKKIIWIPFYLFLIYLIVRIYKWRTIDVLVAVALMIFISDSSSVYFFKEVFHRLRPSHDPILKTMVHLVNNYSGGLYGFVSSHAANAFAICFFVIQIIGKKYKYLTAGMIVWASVVSYSRIYLGVHYPFDVFCGAILGTIIGIGIAKLFQKYYQFVIKS